jgi:hypothetical protein
MNAEVDEASTAGKVAVVIPGLVGSIGIMKDKISDIDGADLPSLIICLIF